jgi:hypothetical protein
VTEPKPDMARAEEAVAEKFSRIMRASVSPYGALTDPVLVCAVVATIVVVSTIVYRVTMSKGLALYLYLLCFVPLAVAFLVDRSLVRARARVVAWLAAQPFPIENMNALLNGVGQNLMVRFREAPPERKKLNDVLEQVSEDSFALEYVEAEHEVEVTIGVVDSKVNPSRANHRRYRRVQELVERALVPIAAEHAIVSVRIR